MTPTTEQGDTNLTISPRRRCSPSCQQENGKFNSTSLPKLEEESDAGPITLVKGEKIGKIHEKIGHVM